MLGHRKKAILTPGNMPSAVLLPIFCKDHEYHLLFTRRTNKVRYHKGQISFPGGAYQTEDGVLQKTALRETTEEVGIAPESIEVLGCLDDVFAHTSGYVISPFAALVHNPGPLKLNRHEVAEVLEVPFTTLMDKSCVRQDVEIRDGSPVPVYFYHFGNAIVWGATAQILTQFLDIITSSGV